MESKCASGQAVTDGAMRCGRSMKTHQGSTLTVVHRHLFLCLFSQKERPFRRLLSRNETGRAATSARHVLRKRRGHPRKHTHLLRGDILSLLYHEPGSGRADAERGAGMGGNTASSSPLAVYP